jgi:hypothetical protein
MGSDVVVSGVLRLSAEPSEALAKARKLGCRVLHVTRTPQACFVAVELPDQTAKSAVTRAVLYDGILFITDRH